jgi:hypothetical protein
MPEVSINMVAVLGSAVGGMIVGMIWYSPNVFGKQWMKLSGMSAADMDRAKQKGMWKLYLSAFVALTVMSYVLAHFVDYVGAVTFGEGMQVGFWSWLGFVATILLGSVLWEGKPIKLYLLNAIHWLVVLMLMGGILTVWM